MDDLEKFPSQLAERFQVRLPDGMRDRLREAAEANNRSMNAEIVVRLEHSFSRYLTVSEKLDVTPRRPSSLMWLTSRIEKMYNDICDKIEAGNKIMEEENKKQRLGLEDRLKELEYRINVRPKENKN